MPKFGIRVEDILRRADLIDSFAKHSLEHTVNVIKFVDDSKMWA